MHPLRTCLFTLPLLLLGACSAKSKVLHLEITTGHEADTFSQDPPVTRITISGKSPDGATAVIATSSPGGTFDLGDVADTESMIFEVTGYDVSGHVLVRGRSVIPISLISTEDATTLPIFVQRVDQWARPPGGLVRAHFHAPAGIMNTQFIFQVGGTAFDAAGETDASVSDFYDFLAMNGATGPSFQRLPETVVSLGLAALIFDANGGSKIDFIAGIISELTLPDNLTSFGHVAGGTPVSDGHGNFFVVGGTRTKGGPSKAALKIASDGTLSAVMLREERLGASAIWIENIGLVVAGGNDPDSGISGVEILPVGTTSFTATPFPADSTIGGASVLRELNETKSTLLLTGGTIAGKVAPTRLLDLNCTIQCSAVPVPSANLPLALLGVSAYVDKSSLNDNSSSADNQRFIVVGEEVGVPDAGLTRTFLLDLGAQTVAELPLKEPRRGASVIPTPLGTLAILGGQHAKDGSPAFSVETFLPR